jgi:phytoene dehydrogenase-like protein
LLVAVNDPVDAIVVGAGMAGLSCALSLAGAGAEVRLLESSDGVGGRVRSDLIDGFRLDRGFQVLLTAYPEVHRVLDLERLRLRKFAPGAMVRVDGGFHRVTDPLRRPFDVLRTLRAPVGSLGDKLRIARLRQRLMRSEPADLLRRPETETRRRLAELGFTDSIVDELFRPWMGGALLDVDLTTSSRMFEILFRCFAAGDSAVPATGMQAISDQLAASLPPNVLQLKTRVSAVSSNSVTLADGTSLSARAVVVATDGPTAARLTRIRDPGSRRSASVWFAADVAPIDSPMLLLDGERSGPASSVAVMSAVAPEYAPDGAALVVASSPGAAADGLVQATRAQLRRWFGQAVERWRHLRTDVIDHALPNQDPPFAPKRSNRVGSGVFVCGDHRDTGSIQGALYSGRRTGERVAEDVLAGRRAS